jgi:hypothetical protein
MRRAIAGLAALLITAGCASDRGAPPPAAANTVTAAYEKTVGIGTGHAIERLRFQLEPGQVLTNITEIEFDVEQRRARIDVRFEASSPELAAQIAGGEDTKLEDLTAQVVRDDHVVYLTIPSSPAFDGGWVRYDGESLPALVAGAVDDLDTFVPTKGLGVLQAAAPATSEPAGNGTTKYRTTVPPDAATGLLAASAVADPDNRDALAGVGEDLPVTVTAGPDGAITSIEYDVTELVRALVDPGTTGTGLRVTYHVTIDRRSAGDDPGAVGRRARGAARIVRSRREVLAAMTLWSCQGARTRRSGCPWPQFGHSAPRADAIHQPTTRHVCAAQHMPKHGSMRLMVFPPDA